MTDDQGIFLDTADRIGARLCRDAVWDGERCNWLGAAPDVVAGQWGTVHRSYGPELYAGTSGIALFLAELFTRTEENIYRDVALGATRHALSRISTALRHCFGLYSGIPGISYALARIAVRLNDDSISKHAIRTLESLRDLPPDRTQLDVLNGSAGLVPGVLALREYHSEEWMIDLAIKHGDFLIEMAHRTDAGWSWNTMNQPDDQQIWNLTGLSHGAGGIAWALLELNAVTGESRFREAAENGFSYERHWYDANQENWPDLRSCYGKSTEEAIPDYQMAWCHGAPGIGLSRLRAYELTSDQAYLNEAETAMRSTYNHLTQAETVPGGNFSLCHGACGNAASLLYAKRIMAIEPYYDGIRAVAMRGIRQHAEKFLSWPCGVLSGAETPNLLLGLAGIGYFYLRLHDPDTVPPILLIHPG